MTSRRAYRFFWDEEKERDLRALHSEQKTYGEMAVAIFGTDEARVAIGQKLFKLGLKMSEEIRRARFREGGANSGRRNLKYKTETERREAKRQQNRKYQRTPEAVARRNFWAREWRKKNYLAHLLRVAKKRAKQKGIAFAISEADVIVYDVCPILGVRITAPGTWHGPSLDRRDNNLGYVPGNVHLVSKRGNTWKGTLAPSDLYRALAYMEGRANLRAVA
jgi:hypothetical protein